MVVVVVVFGGSCEGQEMRVQAGCVLGEDFCWAMGCVGEV